MRCSVDIEGEGAACIVPVPSLPSPQQAELSRTLRRSIRFAFVRTPSRLPCTPESLLRDLDDGRLALGAQDVHVLGTSSLGFIAALYASRVDDVKSLILASVPLSLERLAEHQAVHWDHCATSERKAKLEEKLRQIRPDQLHGRARLLGMSRAYAPMSWFDPNFDPTPLLASVDAAQTEKFRASCVPVIAEFDLPALLRETRCPVLQIHGAQDFTAPLAPWEAVDVPFTKSVILEQSGHHPWYERSEAFDREFRA